MLDEPPKTRFNITQSFALFSAILLWTKNRAWVGKDRLARGGSNKADDPARNAREALRQTNIRDAPWSLSRLTPALVTVDRERADQLPGAEINGDFADMTAERFVKWLRDALAHGDGRTISPIHKWSAKTGKTLLAGFRIVFPAAQGSEQDLTLSLFHSDMVRIGSVLADAFCRALSGGDRYFETEAGTASIDEAA